MADPTIKYGPDQKPWKDTLSKLAISQKGEYMTSPPSLDPLSVYSHPVMEPDITPKFYQVPSIGLTPPQCDEAQDETHSHSAVQTQYQIGYQLCLGDDYSVVSKYLSTHTNNIGDPYVPGNLTLNVKWMERNVLDYFASLWNAKWPHNPEDDDSYWGYIVSMGSSEGNLYSLWNGRDYLQGKFMMTDANDVTTFMRARAPKDKDNEFTPVSFYSSEAHYSVVKAMAVLEIKTFYQVAMEKYPDECPLGGEWPQEVPTEPSQDPNDKWKGSGCVDIDKLCKLVDFFASKGYPPLVVFNYGTTFKGAYDDVEVAGNRLMEIMRKYGLDERTITVENPDKPGETIQSTRKGYWIHVDGALGASYMPFIRMAFERSMTDISPGPNFDFQLPFVCSVITSGHKFPGAPWPTGIIMIKTGTQLQPPSEPDYIGAPDTTFSGSRNGLSALVMWTYISTNSYESQVAKVVRCLLLTAYAIGELKKLQQIQLGDFDIWVAHSPLALAIRFRAPNDKLVYKYSLSVENVQMGDEVRSYIHMYVMGGVTKKLIDDLIHDLSQPGAWVVESDGPKKSKKLVLKSSVGFRRGISLGPNDAGYLKHAKPLMHIPRGGRGFK